MPARFRFMHLISAVSIAGFLAWPAWSIAQSPPPPAPTTAAVGTQPAEDESAPVVVWNREITRLRASLEGLSAQQRAERAARRILAVPSGLPEYRIEARPAALGDTASTVIFVNGMLTVWLLENDADRDAGETLAIASGRAVENLKTFFANRDEQLQLSTVLRGFGWAVGATVLLLVAMIVLLRVSRFLLGRISASPRATQPLHLGKFDVRPYVHAAQSALVRLASWAAGAFALYLWLTFVLHQFPYTRPWGQQLGGFITNSLHGLGLGFVQALPNLFVVYVIYLGTRILTRFAGAFFISAESQWMQVEIARATKRIVVAVLWAFALVVAYPYLPGSGSAAFQGVSVLIGLMVSLGSSGIVSQLLGGLVVVYTRAFSVGEYVKIGEYEGTVTEIGALAAKVMTRRREEITIPYSVLVSSPTTNYSREAKTLGKGARVATKIAIGYDAPWRQVEALLKEAAARTSTVLAEPPPLVLKGALGDFAIDYQLVVNVAHAEERYLMLNELHANILDAFNEHGVQIMTPHFEGQPEGAVVVPRTKWYMAPAAPERPGETRG
jgi:small-conductance mechanosensitive channel